MGERYEKYLEGEYDSANKESQERKDISHAERIYNTVEKLKKEKRDALIDSVLGDEELPPGDEEAIRELFNEYASNKDEYLVDGAVLTCNMAYKGTCYIRGITYGTEVKNVENPRQTRLLVSDNKSEINGQPVATVKDHKEGVNIELFKCNCLNMPDREEEYEAFHDDEECKKYGICRKLMKLDNDWENFIRSTCYLSFSRSTEGDRAQGITMNSVLFCSHGGLITPVTSGQVEASGELVIIYKAQKGAVVSGKSGESAQGAQAGVPVKYNMSTYLSKDKFGKSTPNYYLVNHKDAYVDENGLVRISRISGIKADDDYYCVAMAPGFTTSAEEHCIQAKDGNVNFGYKLQVCFEDIDGVSYNMDVIVAETKASSDPKDFYPHNNLVEFVVDGKPKNTVTDSTGNISYDILLGGNGLEITEVYAYKDGAMITGNYRDGGNWEDR